MKTRLLFCLFTFSLLGCDKQIREFVNSGAKHVPELIEPIFANSSSQAIKISPGANLASGTQGSARYTLTPTQVQLTGTQGDARVSINQNRVQ